MGEDNYMGEEGGGSEGWSRALDEGRWLWMDGWGGILGRGECKIVRL